MRTLVIVGPTASGKTNLAFHVAQALCQGRPNVTGVDILNADSKQVFIGQDIVPGKDLPTGFVTTPVNEKLTAFVLDKVRLFGVSLVGPSDEWSVAHFILYARQVVEYSRESNHVLIVVGGTGLYIDSLFSPPQTLFVPQDPALRQDLEKQTLEVLQQRLQHDDPKRWEHMNGSDQQNPRRLIRAIEVASQDSVPILPLLKQSETFWTGLTVEALLHEQYINDRVKRRLADGALQEYIQVKASTAHWSREARSTIGYAELGQFEAGEVKEDALIDLWTLHEVQYAKRQHQWWKKNHEQIHWYEVAKNGYQDEVVRDFLTWYTEED